MLPSPSHLPLDPPQRSLPLPPPRFASITLTELVAQYGFSESTPPPPSQIGRHPYDPAHVGTTNHYSFLFYSHTILCGTPMRLLCGPPGTYGSIGGTAKSIARMCMLLYSPSLYFCCTTVCASTVIPVLFALFLLLCGHLASDSVCSTAPLCGDYCNHALSFYCRSVMHPLIFNKLPCMLDIVGNIQF